MLRKWLEKLRGSSREPDDMALGTKRPGDFVEPDESGEEPVVPNPHDEDEVDERKSSDPGMRDAAT